MGAKFQNWFSANIWDFRAGNVTLENPQFPINGWTIDQVLGGGGSGQVVGYDTTLTISAVYRAASILEGIISSLPFKVYRNTEQGRIQVKPSEHKLAAMWSRRVNPHMTKVDFISRAVDHYIFWGNHYALIHENGIGQPYQLDLWHPKDVDVYKDKSSGEVTYKHNGTAYPSRRVIHVKNIGDDVCGKGVITKAREDFSLQMYTREYGSNFYKKGGRPAGILSPDQPLTVKQRPQVENAWTEGKRRGGDVVMPFGLKYQAISVPPDDAAFLATNQFGITTVARWFGIPPQKLAELGRATFNNVEAMAIEFLQDTIWPICEKFEAEYDSKLLTLPSELDMYNEFNLDAYQRADSQAKSELYATYITNGIKTPNEIRRLNNDPEDPNGNDLMIQGAMVPLKMAGQQIAQKSAAPAKRRQKRYSLPEIQGVLKERYGLTNEQLDMFAKEKLNGHG